MHEAVPRLHVAPTERTRREPFTARLVVSLDRRMHPIARHWLLAANALVVGWFSLLLLAPTLRVAGLPGLARPIYALVGLACHQDPSRSFALGGHPLACCHRCAAVYGASAVAGLAFAVLRGDHRRARPAQALALLAPMLIDVAGAATGLWESTTAGRLATGALAGLALTWLPYPYLDAGFARLATRLDALFARLATEGRFQ